MKSHLVKIEIEKKQKFMYTKLQHPSESCMDKNVFTCYEETKDSSVNK